MELVIFSHGLLGLAMVFFESSAKDFGELYPELFYLLLVYMWGAVVGTVLKLLRYLYLFKWLPRRLDQHHIPLTIERTLQIF